MFFIVAFKAKLREILCRDTNPDQLTQDKMLAP
jgi:hypothetical protein